jgi:putative membrane-bound dehydrogenase-like protein
MRTTLTGLDRFMMSRLIVSVALSVCFAPAVLHSQPPVLRESPLAPAESLAQIELDSNFQARLLAHEPQVIDPVDAAFDDRGRLWVVEMQDYPFRTDATPNGRVRVLTDADGDGVFEASQVFADQLEMPTGIALWKDGVVLTLAGQLVWMRDTDGDLCVDSQQVWIEGFSRDNEQLRANHPRLGPDGKWYIASGLRGGNVVTGADFITNDAVPLALGSRDVRFTPQTKTLEPITGPAQFGLCFDTLGRRLFCSNRNPAVLVRFEQEDLNGNPLAGLIPSVIDVIPAGEQSHVYPVVNAWTTSNLHAGQFTAACGVYFHSFSKEQSNASSRSGSSPKVRIFACEPTGSLIHSSIFEQRVSPTSRLETATSDKDSHEWLASRDEWFRPVNILASPDDGIVVLDMHRAVIEHPAWVPDELKNRRDERWGNTAGRVYHVAPKGGNTLSAMLKELQASPLSQRSSGELTKLVASSNGWIRETARRLLIEREAVDQVAELEMQALQPDLPSEGRIVSLFLASVLQQKTPSAVTELLASDAATDELKIAALRVAYQNADADANLAPTVVRLATSTSSNEVLLECLRCLGKQTDRPNTDYSASLVASLENAFLIHSKSTAELLVAAGSAMRRHPQMLLTAWLRGMSRTTTDESTEQELVTIAAAARRLAAASFDAETAQVDPILGLVEQLITPTPDRAAANAASQAAAFSLISEILNQRQKIGSLRSRLEASQIWDFVLATATRPTGSKAAVRQQAILLLAQSPRSSDRDHLPELASHSEVTIRSTALRAWSTTLDPACDEYLLQSLSSSSPQLKGTIVELIGQKPARIAALNELMAAGKITAPQIGAVELKKLVTRAKDNAKQQLEAALDSIVNSNRAKVVADYQSCLSLEADPIRGKQVFTKHCASCHKIGDVGVQVGPDISDSRTQQPAQLLTNILDPNRAIDNNYFRFIALTEDDQVIEGMIAEETSDAVVLRGQNNTRHILQRSQLQELRATGVSLMPEGIESQVDQQSMADLIAYIKGWRYMSEGQ